MQKSLCESAKARWTSEARPVTVWCSLATPVLTEGLMRESRGEKVSPQQRARVASNVHACRQPGSLILGTTSLGRGITEFSFKQKWNPDLPTDFWHGRASCVGVSAKPVRGTNGPPKNQKRPPPGKKCGDFLEVQNRATWGTYKFHKFICTLSRLGA